MRREEHLMLMRDLVIVFHDFHVFPVGLELLSCDETAAVSMPVRFAKPSTFVRCDAPKVDVLPIHLLKHFTEGIYRTHDGVIEANDLVVFLEFRPPCGKQHLPVGCSIQTNILPNNDVRGVGAEEPARLGGYLPIDNNNQIRQVFCQFGKKYIDKPAGTAMLVIETVDAETLGMISIDGLWHYHAILCSICVYLVFSSAPYRRIPRRYTTRS